MNLQMMHKHNSADPPDFSARCSRSEGELEPPRKIIYPVSRLLDIRVNVCKPADATPNDIFKVETVLIQKDVVGLWRSVNFFP
jgi:hypothetical protein